MSDMSELSMIVVSIYAVLMVIGAVVLTRRYALRVHAHMERESLRWYAALYLDLRDVARAVWGIITALATLTYVLFWLAVIVVSTILFGGAGLLVSVCACWAVQTCIDTPGESAAEAARRKAEGDEWVRRMLKTEDPEREARLKARMDEHFAKKAQR